MTQHTHDDERLQTVEALEIRACEKIEADPTGAHFTKEEANAYFSRDLIHPTNQVYFRAGLIACREYMARFVEAQSPEIAASIRANWWPKLGKDYGPPRLIDFAELTDGGDEGPWTLRDDITPTLEALPVALAFLESPEPASPSPKERSCARAKWNSLFIRPRSPARCAICATPKLTASAPIRICAASTTGWNWR